MRIAVPTNDGVMISEHFGRSAAFLIFETENGQIKNHELKQNGAKHDHAQGACAQGGPDHQAHSHEGILAAVAGCEMVICAGMGQRAAQALKEHGIGIAVTSAGPAEAAVLAHLQGKLAAGTASFCGCRH